MTSPRPKVLITGVNGFLGLLLSKKLIQEGYKVVGLSRTEPPIKLTKFIQASVLNFEKVNEAMEGCEVVIHLAALTSHSDIINNKNKTLEINLQGTRNVLEAFNKNTSCKRFLYSSTGKTYGRIVFLPITEEHPTRPLNILGKSKLITEQLIDFYATSQNPLYKDYSVLRIFNVYGPGQKENFLIPTILNQIEFNVRSKQSITLGDVDSKRDYLYVEDVLGAFTAMIEAASYAIPFNAFNVASGVGVNAKEIVLTLSRLLDIPIAIKTDPKRLRNDEMPDEFGDYGKLKAYTGWKPTISLNDGLLKTIEYYKGTR